MVALCAMCIEGHPLQGTLTAMEIVQASGRPGRVGLSFAIMVKAARAGETFGNMELQGNGTRDL